MELDNPTRRSGALVRSIMYQQLAGRCDGNLGRFMKLFEKARAGRGAGSSPGAMRAAGVSGPKEAAITDLSARWRMAPCRWVTSTGFR
jgi:hypothetical protein